MENVPQVVSNSQLDRDGVERGSRFVRAMQMADESRTVLRSEIGERRCKNEVMNTVSCGGQEKESASWRNRTVYLLLTKQLLYQMS
jgi:hypothetical protein